MFQRSGGARMAGTVFNSHHRGQRDDKTEAWWPPYLCDPLPEQIVETAECACLARQTGKMADNDRKHELEKKKAKLAAMR